MLSVTGKLFVVTFVHCACFLPVAVSSEPLLAGSGEETMPKDRHTWVLGAEKLIEELSDLAQATVEVRKAGPLSELSHTEWMEAFRKNAGSWSERLAQRRRAERILWKLWLTTGKPPLTPEVDETSKTFRRRNAVAYRRYVARHAALTQRDLHRIGLANAVNSFSSPLWYMTLKYVTNKTGLDPGWTVDVYTIPSHIMMERRSSEENYRRLSTAYSRWLKANRELMTWDQYRGSFRSKDSRYIETDDLREAISNIIFSEKTIWGEAAHRNPP